MSDSSFMDWSISINGNTIKGIDVKPPTFVELESRSSCLNNWILVLLITFRRME
jgi:hypothetical protein